MEKKTSPKPGRDRLVVHVSPREHAAIAKDAKALGLKNAHQWAAMKLATAIREAGERFK